MRELSPSSTRVARLLLTLSTGALWGLITVWLLFVLAWGVLHGWIVPRIAEYRPALETQATQALGVPVRIGDIVAQSSGLIPSFELRDVVLLDQRGQEALRLTRVLAAVSPRSLLNLGFEQLHIDRPALDVRRTADGRILVAGLDLSKGAEGDGRGADWLFSQTELVIRQGALRWTDELRSAPPLALTEVDMVVRNSRRRHALRLDATPPPDWGDRFTLVAQFRQPLLSARRGQWQNWVGQVYGRFDRVDVSQLRRHADLGPQVYQGRGALRVWADIHRAALTGATVDLALSEVLVRLDTQLPPLGLRSVQGRLGGRRLADGFELQTEGLQFDTQAGVHWPGGQVFLSYSQGQDPLASRGELRADRLDLTALSQVATQLPLGTATHAALQAYAPAGLVESIQARWQGPVGAWTSYEARGRASGLSLASQPRPGGAGIPGVRGVTLDFDLNQSGGKASLQMARGALDFPGVFDEPVMALDRLSADVAWQTAGDRLAVQVKQLRFAGADAEGEAQAQWHTGDAGRGRGRFPGHLDLQGQLSRADGTRVYRYLPATIPRAVRDYVQDAVSQGRASQVRFRVKGDLLDFPFEDPRQGEFRIAARLHDVNYAFAPRSILPREAPDWFALTRLSGELVFERNGMQLNDVRAGFSTLPGATLTAGQARIPDLSRSTTVLVQADARGPAPEFIAMVEATPIGTWVDHALARTRSSGPLDLRLRLNLPIMAIERSKVQGSVTLAGNELQIAPEVPALTRVRGVVAFNEAGFSVSGVQARMLGGDIRLDGGLKPAAQTGEGEPRLSFKAQGVATAEGLRQAQELGFVSRLAQRASGATPYQVQFGLRRGVPELSVTSSLQGLALTLPPPFAKAADAVLPLRYENAVLRSIPLDGRQPADVALGDQLLIEVGRVASGAWVRDLSGPGARVVRGGLAIGPRAGDDFPTPQSGVVANIQLPAVDLDAWEAVLTDVAGAAVVQVATGGVDAQGADYLPTTVALQATDLTVAGRRLHDVVLGSSREGSTWRANVDARELNGYLDYRPATAVGASRVFARLSRLTLPQSAVADVETLLDSQATAIPALDVVVDNFELRGKRLGRLEIDAINRNAASRDGPAEWRLRHLGLTVPEARFVATGNWAVLQDQPRRRTVMNFKLDMGDAGELLARLGMKDVVRRGKGTMQGQVSWLGSPLALDYASLDGHLAAQVDNGQFLKADPGLAKLLGVLNLQTLPRRLTLDFRDVFSEGFAFDFVRGDVQIERGMAATNNLQMKGVNAVVLMDGKADLARETQDLRAVVVPEINAGTASLVATAINPAIGVGTFLAQLFLRRPLMQATTEEFHIDGTWADPHVTRMARRVPETMSDAAAPPAAPASTAGATP